MSITPAGSDALRLPAGHGTSPTPPSTSTLHAGRGAGAGGVVRDRRSAPRPRRARARAAATSSGVSGDSSTATAPSRLHRARRARGGSAATSSSRRRCVPGSHAARDQAAHDRVDAAVGLGVGERAAAPQEERALADRGGLIGERAAERDERVVLEVAQAVEARQLPARVVEVVPRSSAELLDAIERRTARSSRRARCARSSVARPRRDRRRRRSSSSRRRSSPDGSGPSLGAHVDRALGRGRPRASASTATTPGHVTVSAVEPTTSPKWPALSVHLVHRRRRCGAARRMPRTAPGRPISSRLPTKYEDRARRDRRA